MRKTLALDAPLVMLLTAGACGAGYIARHKRLHPIYGPRHYEVLKELIRRARAVATTTHALAEASNLLRQCSDPMRSEIMASLAGIIGTIDEVTPAAREVCKTPEFIRLGLTDAAFAQLDPKRCQVVSADRDLVIALQSLRFEVINFQDVLFD